MANVESCIHSWVWFFTNLVEEQILLHEAPRARVLHVRHRAALQVGLQALHLKVALRDGLHARVAGCIAPGLNFLDVRFQVGRVFGEAAVGGHVDHVGSALALVDTFSKI